MSKHYLNCRIILENQYFIFLTLFFLCDDNEIGHIVLRYFLFYVVFPSFIINIFFSMSENGDLNYKTRNFKFQFDGNIVRLIKSKLFIIVIVYLTSLSFSTSVYPEYSFYWLKTMLYFSFSIIVFVLLGALLFKISDTFEQKLLLVFPTVVSLNALYNLLAYVNTIRAQDTLADIHFWITHRFSAIYGISPWHNENPSGFTYGLFALLSIFYLSLMKVNDRYKLSLCLLNIFILTGSLFLTQSRSALLGFLVILTLHIIIFSVNNIIFLRKCISSNIIYFVVLDILLIAGLVFIKPIIEEFILYRDFGRFEIWSLFVELFFERPIFGYGQRLLTIVYMSDNLSVNNPHNIYISALIYGGIVGGIAIVLIFIFSFYNVIRLYIYSDASYLLLILLYTMICGSLDYSLSVMPPNWNWIVYWLPISLCLGAELKYKIRNNYGVA